jgi:hypothetical protein
VGEQPQSSSWDPILAEYQARARRLTIEGVSWIVYEDRPRGLEARPSLVFFGPGFARRVRQYPENWRELADDQLLSLSWTR